MILSDCQAQIAEMVRQQDFIRVEVLATHFNVTTQTIRRDLNLLCDRGMVRRLHGGVQWMNLPGNVAYSWCQTLSSHAKPAIAWEVARHASDGVSLAFSIVTTPEIVSKELMDHRWKIPTPSCSSAKEKGPHEPHRYP